MTIGASVSPSHLLVQVELENSEAEPIDAKHWLEDWYGHEAVAALPSPITALQRTDAFERFG